MSIDFLEYLRLQFPWLVMPSTTPFSPATRPPRHPDEVPPIIVRPGPPGGIGQDVKGPAPEQPKDTRTPEQKRQDERDREKLERESERVRKEWDEERERIQRQIAAGERISPSPKLKSGQTPEEKKQSEIFRRLMEQQVIIGEPQRGPAGGGVLAAGASTDDADEEGPPDPYAWREWSPEAMVIWEQLQNIDDPERRQKILEDAVDPETMKEGFLWNVPLPSNIWDYMSGGRIPSGYLSTSPEELQEKAHEFKFRK